MSPCLPPCRHRTAPVLPAQHHFCFTLSWGFLSELGSGLGWEAILVREIWVW